MDTQPTQQALRREAVSRRLQGQRVCDIGHDRQRTPRWLNKGWREYQRHPDPDFTEQGRAPRTSPQQMPPEIGQAVVALRRMLEAGQTPDTRYGLIGARAIWGKVPRLHVPPLPSVATIQRLLAKQGLTHPLGANHDAAYYPWPVPWEINAIEATDIIPKPLLGGEVIQH